MKPVSVFYHLLALILFFSVLSNRAPALSIPEEREIGKTFIAEIKKQNMLLHDPIANHMVNEVARHLLSILPPQPFDYSFYIVNDDVFNAFAAPGANIFAYRGLITALDSVDELAGIIAHEIAHSASRHVAESINRSKYIAIGSLAGMLAGAVIGSKSGGEAGMTLMKGSIAAGHTAMLAFTRENETEADEKGILFLKQSCFSPEGLLSGLMKIKESDFRGVENIPDYVKTHPGTGSRIAHVETILSGYAPPETKPGCRTDFRFDMVKYRLLGLYGNLEPAYAVLTRRLTADPDNAALHYGLGLAYDRKFRKTEALSHLKKALAINIVDPMILLELGRIYQETGEPRKALDLLKTIESDPVLGVMARFHQACAHLELKNLKQAEALFRSVIEKAPAAYPSAYHSLANIMSQENQPGLSHYYLGLYYSETGPAGTAILHLKKALETLRDTDRIDGAKALLEELIKDEQEAAARKTRP